MATGSIKANRSQILAAFGLFSLVFYPIYPDLVTKWMDSSDDSYGLMVPFISAYLIWNRRDSLRNAEKKCSGWGLVILSASLLLYLLALLGAVTVVSRSMIVCGLIGLILYIFGGRVFAIVAFPVCYLFFMIPVPESLYQLLAFPLQMFASQISTVFISVIGIPVLRDGNILYFAQTQLEVSEACSGLRSMTSFIMLSSLFASMMKTNWIRRLGMLSSAIPLAIFANIVRVTGTGVLAHFIGEKAAQGFLHGFSGMVVFLFGLALLFMKFRLLEQVGLLKIRTKIV